MSAEPQDKDKSHGNDKPGKSEHSDPTHKADTANVPDQLRKNRPLTDDEKVEQASRESMDASDPPAFQPSTTGAAPERKHEKEES